MDGLIKLIPSRNNLKLMILVESNYQERRGEGGENEEMVEIEMN
jgi:hypothetical protein